MKNFYIHISSLIIVVLVFMSSCQHKPNTTIAQALLLAGEHPDSALALLNNMQFSELGKSEQAKYAVVYTMAQDKSGLDGKRLRIYTLPFIVKVLTFAP